MTRQNLIPAVDQQNETDSEMSFITAFIPLWDLINHDDYPVIVALNFIVKLFFTSVGIS